MRRAREAIREGLAGVWDSGGRTFVTFELLRHGEAAPDAWAQWIDGQLNLAWPRDDDPAAALARLGVSLPAGAYVESWQGGSNVIVNALDVRIDDVAAFLDRWFQRVLDAEPKYEVEVRTDRA
jgi:hypothetical protein